MSVLKRFFKDTIIYGIAAVLPRVINFLLVRIQTDALPAAKYSENTDFYIWAGLFSVLLTFGLETAFFRFYSKEGQNKDKLVGTSFITMLATSGLFVLIISIFSEYSLEVLGFGTNKLRLNMFLTIMALDTIAMIPFAYLRASNHPIKYAAIKLFNVSIIVISNLIFLKYIPTFIEEGRPLPKIIIDNYGHTAKVDYVFIANALGSAFSFILLLPALLKFKLTFDFNLLKKLIRYSWPIAVAGVAYLINENLDKFLIKRMIGDQEMGIYSACYKLAIFMNLYIMGFRLGAEPFFFNYSKNKNAKTAYALIMNYFVIVGALALVFIVAYLDIFKVIFINNAYWEAIKIVPIILLANLFLGIYHNLAIWYKLTDKTRYGMYFSILGAIVTIILNVTLLEKFGYMVAAYATLIAYGTMCFVSYLFGQKYYPIAYNVKRMSLYVLAAILVCGLSFKIFRGQYLISTLLVALFALLVYWKERETLTMIFKGQFSKKYNNGNQNH